MLYPADLRTHRPSGPRAESFVELCGNPAKPANASIRRAICPITQTARRETRHKTKRLKRDPQLESIPESREQDLSIGIDSGCSLVPAIAFSHAIDLSKGWVSDCRPTYF